MIFMQASIVVSVVAGLLVVGIGLVVICLCLSAAQGDHNMVADDGEDALSRDQHKLLAEHTFEEDE